MKLRPPFSGLCCLAVVLLFFLPASFAFAKEFDHSALDAFLKKYVDAEGRVNYRAARENRADLDRYLAQMEKTDLKALQNESKPERLAFWLNVYHAALLEQVLRNYPLRSSEDIPDFWNRQFIYFLVKSSGVNGMIEEKTEGMSLAQVRESLMVDFEDEKLHLVLASAAKDGPLFPREVFTRQRILGQIFKKVRFEVNRPVTFKADKAQSRIYLSRIFEWYAPDFISHFGRPERRGKLSRPDTAVVNFLIHYLKTAPDVRFLKTAKYKIEYQPFDWSLNDTPASAQ